MTRPSTFSAYSPKEGRRFYLKLEDMIYKIDGMTFLPNENQIEDMGLMIEMGLIESGEVKFYLSGAWN